MTATYTNQPGVRDVDTVRLLVYDRNTTTATSAKLSDEEIQYFIDANTHINFAAAEAALAIAARHAAEGTSKWVGDLKVDGVGISYRDLSDKLRLTAARRGVTPYAGGLSIADADAVAKDTDRPAPDFERGMHDHEKAEQTADRGVMDF